MSQLAPVDVLQEPLRWEHHGTNTQKLAEHFFGLKISKNINTVSKKDIFLNMTKVFHLFLNRIHDSTIAKNKNLWITPVVL